VVVDKLNAEKVVTDISGTWILATLKTTKYIVIETLGATYKIIKIK